jgi:UPF0716 protein FxsA
MNPLLLILVMPLLEIAVFVEVGSLIGTWQTVLLMLLSMLAGTALLRAQGQAVRERLNEAARRGQPPVGAAFDTFCVVAAAVLLIVPGFLTDALALALLIPPVRAFLGRWLFGVWVARAGVRFGETVSRAGPPAGARGDVIDGEFRTLDEEESPPPPRPRLDPAGRERSDG